MKRIFVMLLCAAMLLSLLSGCGSKPAAPTVPEEPSAETIPAVEVEPLPEPAEAEPAAPEAAPEAVTVRLGALTGPTVMGMVKLLKDADTGSSYTYQLMGSADELTPLILQNEVDIVSVPANLASVLYNKTEGGVRALAVNVLGVLYIAEYNTQEISSIADLKGKTIYATGKGSTPEYFLRYLLTENGLDPDNDVTMAWQSEPAAVVELLSKDGAGVAMLPQPYVTAAAAKLGEGFRVALSVSDEWAALDNGSMCTTAVVMVRSEFADAHPEAVEAFLADFAASVDWVNSNVADAAVICEELGFIKAAVAEKAIPKCNIVCITGQPMKDALGGCLGVLFSQNPKAVGGALPQDDFYYGA